MIEKNVPGRLREYRAYKNDGARQKLKKLFPALFREDGFVFREITDTEIDAAFWNRIDTFAANSTDLFLLMELLCGFDTALRNRMEMEIEIFGVCTAMHSLNDNFAETEISLLPYTETFWERKSRGSQHSYEINGLLKNFMYIDERELERYEVNRIQHILLNSFLFQPAIDKGYLRIGFSPLSRNLKLNISAYIRDHIRYFSVENKENSKIIKQAVFSVLEKAKKEKVDILFFPEMIGSVELVAAVKEKLEEFFPEEEGEYPALIILPSIWKDNENSTVILTRDGESVCIQKKQYPYDGPIEPGGERMLEDIEPDKTIHLIHCKGLGRMAVMICKDFLAEKYLELVLQILKAKLILVPSMSTGEYDFKTQANICEHLDCCVLQCNCCSAEIMVREDQRDKMNIIGYILKSGKNQNPRYVNVPADGAAQILRPKRCREGGCEGACLFWEDFFFDKDAG